MLLHFEPTASGFAALPQQRVRESCHLRIGRDEWESIDDWTASDCRAVMDAAKHTTSIRTLDVKVFRTMSGKALEVFSFLGFCHEFPLQIALLARPRAAHLPWWCGVVWCGTIRNPDIDPFSMAYELTAANFAECFRNNDVDNDELILHRPAAWVAIGQWTASECREVVEATKSNTPLRTLELQLLCPLSVFSISTPVFFLFFSPNFLKNPRESV